MKKFKIMLIEDNPGDIALTMEAFKSSEGMQIKSIATDGEEAFSILQEIKKTGEAAFPDLILLDINLPKINGLELLTMLKKDDTLKIIPVIMLTTSDAEIDICESYKNYANSYIVKPVEIDKFINTIVEIENYWLKTGKLPVINNAAV